MTYREFVSMREGASEPRARAQTKQIFDAADTDGDEVLSLEEFIAAGEQRAGDPTREADEPARGTGHEAFPMGRGSDEDPRTARRADPDHAMVTAVLTTVSSRAFRICIKGSNHAEAQELAEVIIPVFLRAFRGSA